jgi:nicotinamidase-related amidase|tara:strand:+ start:2343 stop:2999 length:657 start_codon:yes stop_codon:yes gene_type:complete
MSKSNIFFNVDTQQDFFNDEGLDIPNNESILKNLSILSEYVKTNNLKTIHSIRWFKEDSDFFSEMPDYRKTLPKHCLKDTKGARFINETAPFNYFLVNWEDDNLSFPEIHRNSNIVVTKKTQSLFEGNSFSEALINNLGVPFMERPTFYLYGVDVGKTALELLMRGYTVYIVNDANINVNGQPFKKEDIIAQVMGPDSDVAPKEVLELKTILTKELID